MCHDGTGVLQCSMAVCHCRLELLDVTGRRDLCVNVLLDLIEASHTTSTTTQDI